jgi:hypothetical protein
VGELFRVLGSGGGKGGLLKMSVVWVGHFAAVRGASSVFSVEFRVYCISGRCRLAVPLGVVLQVVPELFFVWMGRGNWGRCDTI